MRALAKAKAKEWGVPKEIAQMILIKRSKRKFDRAGAFRKEKILIGDNGNGNKNRNGSKEFMFA